jgi:hypothetical protein
MNWPARIASIIIALQWALLLRFLFADLAYGLPPAQGSTLFGLAIVACLALFAAWRWPRAGGWIAVIAGIAFILVGTRTTLAGAAAFAGLWMALPFILTGLLFVATGEARAGRLRLSRGSAAGIGAALLVVTLALIAMTLLLGASGGGTVSG